jgi:hypothetical protein
MIERQPADTNRKKIWRLGYSRAFDARSAAYASVPYDAPGASPRKWEAYALFRLGCGRFLLREAFAGNCRLRKLPTAPLNCFLTMDCRQAAK